MILYCILNYQETKVQRQIYEFMYENINNKILQHQSQVPSSRFSLSGLPIACIFLSWVPSCHCFLLGLPLFLRPGKPFLAIDPQVFLGHVQTTSMCISQLFQVSCHQLSWFVLFHFTANTSVDKSWTNSFFDPPQLHLFMLCVTFLFLALYSLLLTAFTFACTSSVSHMGWPYFLGVRYVDISDIIVF